MSGKNPLLPRILVVLALGAAIHGGSCLRQPLRVGTFNIERFGEPSKTTDLPRVTALIEETGAAVLGVQEMMDDATVAKLMTSLSHDGHVWKSALSKCGGSGRMRVGYFYDATRVTLVRTKEHQELDPDPSDDCRADRPGLSAKFARADGGQSFQLLVFHLVMGNKPDQQEKRRDQWKRAHKIAANLARETPVAILGDANSTGFLDNAGGERDFILKEAKAAKLEVTTTNAKCTEYWRPKSGGPLEPSLLDHVVATPGLTTKMRVHGYCAALSCESTTTTPSDFTTVSDHCPVTVDL